MRRRRSIRLQSRRYADAHVPLRSSIFFIAPRRIMIGLHALEFTALWAMRHESPVDKSDR